MTTRGPASTINPSKSNDILLGRYSRTFLLSLSGINLVLGLIFYLYSTFFGITGIVSLVRGITVSGDASTWAWTGYFLIAAAGCLLLLQRYGWHRRQAEIPTSTMPRGARLFFGIQTGAVGIFGIMMLLVPGLAQQEFWPWKVYVSTLQTFAALFLATCLATGWATQQKDPERIKVLLPLDAVFLP